MAGIGDHVMAVSVIFGLIITTTSLLLWMWRNSKFRQAVDRLPGPRALPLIGNAHILKTDGHDFFDQVMEFCNNYGSKEGIFRLWLGPHPAIVLTKAHTVEILLNSSKHITKAREYDMVMPWLGTGLLTSTGEKWRTRRKQLTPTFHFKILQDFLHVFNEQSRVMVKRLETQADKAIDIFPFITLCALDIICETAMGKNIDAQSKKDSEYVKAVYRIGEIIQNRMKKPWLRVPLFFNLTSDGKVHNKCLKILHKFTRDVIEERSAELDEQLANQTGKVTMEDLQKDKPFLIGKQKRLAFLDMLLVAAKGSDALSHSDIQEEVDTFMFEGHDTTAAAGNWATHLLGLYPDVQKRAQEELDDIFGDSDRDVTMEDLKNMKYLECVIKEALRLYPSVPMFARVIEENCQIAGYTIPKRSSAMIITSALHRDPEHFPEPDKFDPERWRPENSAGRHPYCYIPFSAGLRNCIGQRFAMNEEKTMVSYILRNFNIKSHQKGWEDVRPVGQLILRPEKGIDVTLTKRN